MSGPERGIPENELPHSQNKNRRIEHTVLQRNIPAVTLQVGANPASLPSVVPTIMDENDNTTNDNNTNDNTNTTTSDNATWNYTSTTTTTTNNNNNNYKQESNRNKACVQAPIFWQAWSGLSQDVW